MSRRKSLVIVFGLVFTLLLNSFCFADPAEKKDIEMLRSTGQVFAEISEKATPAVVFVSVCAIIVPLEADAPVTLLAGVTVYVQLKVVFATLLVRMIFVVPWPHKVWEDGIAVANGLGFTVTVTFVVPRVQP